MLYSSSKGRISELLTSSNGTIAIRLEINSGADLVEGDVFQQLHPLAVAKASGFSKPSRPSRGGRRLVRGGGNQTTQN